MSGRYHDPALVAEAVCWLAPGPDLIVVDGTVGGGGHAEAILSWVGPAGERIQRLIGIDKDMEALAAARARLDPFGERLSLRHADFADLPAVLREEGLEAVDGILLDLGASFHQLTVGRRGFSLRQDAPLDMRMDKTAGESAAELLERVDERGLERLLREFGEEPAARRIARAIVARRREGRPVRTTAELAALAESVAGRRGGKIHPATRTFMALRIAVNRELERLDTVLESIPDRLRPGGRAVVISYHSLEDRRVKESFAREQKGCVCPPVLPRCVCGRKPRMRTLTRRPVTPAEAEVSRNPAARSAKLRAAERLPA
jgi:16S rRNA (cytosine1402-N4)-methyltransferase